MDKWVSSCVDLLSYEPSVLKFTFSLLCTHNDPKTNLNMQPHSAKLINSEYIQCTIALHTVRHIGWLGTKFCYVKYVYLICYFSYSRTSVLSNSISSSTSYSRYSNLVFQIIFCMYRHLLYKMTV